MSSFAKVFDVWNRRLHFYLGLYFLFFLWLFSLTGLMLNHQQWFTDLYDRHQVSYDPEIRAPFGVTRAEQTFDVMRQLNLHGEVDWPALQPVGHIDFNVSRPDGFAQVRVDLNAKQAYVKEFTNSSLHAFQVFHTFSGSRFNQPDSRRDWIVTGVWVFAMDALAAGLIVMVLGSYYMWWRLKKQKRLGLVTLIAGFVICGAFVAGLL
jgi:hypothetical protein